MKFISFFMIASFLTVEAFLINFNPTTESLDSYKLCKNCAHIIEDDETRTRQCRQFGSIDVVSGTVSYYACSVARSEELLCGQKARFFNRYIPFNETQPNNSD